MSNRLSNNEPSWTKGDSFSRVSRMELNGRESETRSSDSWRKVRGEFLVNLCSGERGADAFVDDSRKDELALEFLSLSLSVYKTPHLYCTEDRILSWTVFKLRDFASERRKVSYSSFRETRFRAKGATKVIKVNWVEVCFVRARFGIEWEELFNGISIRIYIYTI